MFKALRLSKPRKHTGILSQCRYESQTKTCEPLRILFCGSDNFSIASFNRLHREMENDPEFIQSVDVICRRPKRAGTGLKIYKPVPIEGRVRELGFRPYYVDTFRGWDPPPELKFNLIVAVSFGLLIPPRILGLARYGGLNVHPSMLPQLRGAAPVHHALMRGLERTGVTLQTLHPTRMDAGAILAQTPAPGIAIPSAYHVSVEALTMRLASLSASLLVTGLRQRLFVPPVRDLTPELDVAALGELYHASKITPMDRHIDWTTWSAERICRHNRVIGPLWCMAEEFDSRKQHRTIWGGAWKTLEDFVQQDCKHNKAYEPPRRAELVCEPGWAYVSHTKDYLIVGTSDGKFLVAKDIWFAGGERKETSAGDRLLKNRILPRTTWEQSMEPDAPIRLPKPFI